jgi:hypothetical protein
VTIGFKALQYQLGVLGMRQAAVLASQQEGEGESLDAAAAAAATAAALEAKLQTPRMRRLRNVTSLGDAAIAEAAGDVFSGVNWQQRLLFEEQQWQQQGQRHQLGDSQSTTVTFSDQQQQQVGQSVSAPPPPRRRHLLANGVPELAPAIIATPGAKQQLTEELRESLFVVVENEQSAAAVVRQSHVPPVTGKPGTTWSDRPHATLEVPLLDRLKAPRARRALGVAGSGAGANLGSGSPQFAQTARMPRPPTKTGSGAPPLSLSARKNAFASEPVDGGDAAVAFLPNNNAPMAAATPALHRRGDGTCDVGRTVRSSGGALGDRSPAPTGPSPRRRAGVGAGATAIVAPLPNAAPTAPLTVRWNAQNHEGRRRFYDDE